MASAEPRLWRSNAAASPQLHIWGLGTAALAEDSLRRPAAIPHVVPSYQRTIAVASARLRRTIALAIEIAILRASAIGLPVALDLLQLDPQLSLPS